MQLACQVASDTSIKCHSSRVDRVDPARAVHRTPPCHDLLSADIRNRCSAQPCLLSGPLHPFCLLQALNAAVRVAQQSSDDVCLAHALASLCHLLAEAPSPGATPGAPAAGGDQRGPAEAHRQQLLLLLRTCLRRAHELRLPHLVAFRCGPLVVRQSVRGLLCSKSVSVSPCIIFPPSLGFSAASPPDCCVPPGQQLYILRKPLSPFPCSRLALARFDMQHVRLLPTGVPSLPAAGPLGTDPVEVSHNPLQC